MGRNDWTRLTERFEAARMWNVREKPAHAAKAFGSLLDELWRAEPTLTGDLEHEAWVTLTVRSLLGRALASYALSGNLESALELTDLAETTAMRSPSEVSGRLHGVIAGQRGLLYLRSGHFVRAATLFDVAVEACSPDDHRDLAVALLNRGNAVSQTGDSQRALRDYERALEHGAAAELEPLVAFAQHNIGYVRHILGDLPGALQAMAIALRLAPDQDDGTLLLGRAEVLFESGLLADAELLLTEAIPLLAASGLRLDRAEAEYYRARCLLALQRYDEARAQARHARRHFEHVGHAPRAVLARVLELEAALTPTRLDGSAIRATARRHAGAALRAADAGDAAGPVLGHHPGHAARIVAAQWFLQARDVGQARQVLEQAPRDTPGAPLTLRLQRYVATAELAFAERDRRRGLRAVRGGFGLLAEHRTRLGSVESVTAAAVHGVELQWIDVRAALATGRPAALFDALERGRATGAGVGRVTPPDDLEAAALLTEARGLLAKARDLPATGDLAATAEREALTRRARRIQAEVRERSWRHAGEAVGPERAVTAREVTRLLAQRGDGAVVVNFSVVDAHLRAVRVDGRGATTIDLGPTAGVAERFRRVRADLAITANDLIPAPLRAAAQGSLRRSLQALDDALVVPLRATGDLYVAARDPLITIPWSALPSRAGLRTAVRSYVARGRSQATPSGGRRVLTAAGPGVAQGEAEANAVGAVWLAAAGADLGVPADPGAQARQATVLTGAAATTDAVRKALATHDVVHLATHGRHDADNPLFASIELADGPLFAHELDGLRLPDSVVVLSSCEVGGHTAVLGGEVLGLTSVLLRLGARAVIASVAPLSDALAAEVMPRLHAHLRDTDDPEAALAAALADMSEPVPLVCFGSLEGLTS